MLRNIRIVLEYDGGPFQGWQVQANGPSIQGHLEQAVEEICGRHIFVRGAGRTDAGVHARGQVANFKVDSRIPAEQWREALNVRLPPEIRVLKSDEADLDFSALKSARSKIYEYRVLNRRVASALDRRVYFYPGRLDWGKIAACLPYFVGEKDFRCFQGAGATVKTTVRSVLRFELQEQPEGLYRFEIEGSGFLKQMVRSMIGTVMEVGEGRREAHTLEEMIASGDRTRAGRTVPASGLCLLEVKY